MTGDLVKRLRRVSMDLGVPSTTTLDSNVVAQAADRIEALDAKLAKAVGLLEAWVNVAAHCTIEEGVCCCGDNMDTHSDPMDCGHLPVDHGAYVVVRLVEKTLATLAELTRGKDD